MVLALLIIYIKQILGPGDSGHVSFQGGYRVTEPRDKIGNSLQGFVSFVQFHPLASQLRSFLEYLHTICTMAKATRPENVPQEEVDHFEKIPWCCQTLDDPSFRIVSMSRTVSQPGYGHSLMGDTLNTKNTIPHLLSFYRKPDPIRGVQGEVRRFYTFGRGLNAHPDLLHGGIIANILDSSMGNVIGQELRSTGAMFTVALNITYKKAVPTPGTILARAHITKVDGPRKVWVHGSIEDGRGGIHATAEGMWLKAKAKI